MRLERGQQPGQVADQPAGLAAGQLGDVRVLLLRHDRAAGGEGVVQGDVAELRGRPDDHFLGDAGQVHADHGQHERGLGGEVARRGAVDRVGRRRSRSPARRPPPPGPAPATSRPARRTRTATPRPGGPSPAAGPRRAAARARARPGGARAAPAGRAAGGCGRASARPGAASAWASSASTTSSTPGRDPAGGVPQPHPEQRGDLVVAGPAGPQLAAELGPARSIRPALQRGVHVLVVRRRAEGARTRRRPPACPARPACRSARRRSSSPARCSTRACAREPRDVVGRQPPVEVGGPATARPTRPPGRPRTGHPTARSPLPLHLRLGRSGESAAPLVQSQLAQGPQALVAAAAILLGRPQSWTKPLASDWSKVSPSS